jgi:hypothetical protein
LHEESAPQFGTFNKAAIRDPKEQPAMYQVMGPEAKKVGLASKRGKPNSCYERPDYEGIMGRTGEQTLKYATIRAISAQPGKPAYQR